jgi:integrase
VNPKIRSANTCNMLRLPIDILSDSSCAMRWSEIDFERSTWTIPAARSKNGKAHTLPLMPAALEIVESVPRMATRDHLFGARSAAGFTAWTKKATLDERSGVKDWRLHDIRRTTATRLADLGVAPHVIEQILNHQSGHKAGPAGIYNRSSYEREVRAALAMWSDHMRNLVEGGERKFLPMIPVPKQTGASARPHSGS